MVQENQVQPTPIDNYLMAQKSISPTSPQLAPIMSLWVGLLQRTILPPLQLLLQELVIFRVVVLE